MSSHDSDRPPVLAHRRFAADRENFAGLNLPQRFRRIYETNLWGAVASASGLGSEIDATAVLRAELPRLLEALAVTSLLDAPCGDAGWISAADLRVRIIGLDIVPALIARLQANAAAGDIRGEYQLADYTLMVLALTLGARPLQLASIKVKDMTESKRQDGTSVFILQVTRLKQGHGVRPRPRPRAGGRCVRIPGSSRAGA